MLTSTPYEAPRPRTTLDVIDHVAIPVRSIPESVAWYMARFRCLILHQDATWALLGFDNVRLALVVPEQHPGHVGFLHSRAADYGALSTHRDGSRSVYLEDPAGNTIELLDPESMPGGADHG